MPAAAPAPEVQSEVDEATRQSYGEEGYQAYGHEGHQAYGQQGYQPYGQQGYGPIPTQPTTQHPGTAPSQGSTAADAPTTKRPIVPIVLGLLLLCGLGALAVGLASGPDDGDSTRSTTASSTSTAPTSTSATSSGSSTSTSAASSPSTWASSSPAQGGTTLQVRKTYTGSGN